MQFDPALAAQAAFRDAEAELGSDWAAAAELEETFSSNAGSVGREAYEALLALARRHPKARAFHAFCIYITWQQATEETIARHFRTGIALCRSYLASPGGTPREVQQITELLQSFRAGLGDEDADEQDIADEFRRDALKGGD